MHLRLRPIKCFLICFARAVFTMLVSIFSVSTSLNLTQVESELGNRFDQINIQRKAEESKCLSGQMASVLV